jgi:hypothetical protein
MECADRTNHLSSGLQMVCVGRAHVCVCVYVYVSVRVRMHACVCVCARARAYIGIIHVGAQTYGAQTYLFSLRNIWAALNVPGPDPLLLHRSRQQRPLYVPVLELPA